MSWIEKIQQQLSITCGDGKTFSPLYVFTNKSVEYNISEFEFVDIEGALVKRRKAKARRFELEIVFQGENNLENADDFENSAKDPRPWVISHPLHGDLTVQPVSLGFDYRNINVTRITGTVIETLVESTPRGTVDPIDTITESNEKVTASIATSYSENVTPTATDVNDLTNSNSTVYNEGKVLAKEGEESDNYFNAFSNANAAILDATSEPLAAMNKLQAVINAPALFQETIVARFNQFKNQIDKFRAQLSGITTKNQKYLYQSNVGGVLNAMAYACANPIAKDFAKKQGVFDTIDVLLNSYNQYITDLDSLQSLNGGSPGSFIPTFETMNDLTNLINFTLSNLFNIALGAKQERFVFLETDSNVILLAHRFYGLVPDDSTIDELIEQNEIGLTEILNIKAGRKIIYFIE
jgi:hypothetical protein